MSRRLTEEQRRALAAAAATIDERLGGDFRPLEVDGAEEIRAERWRIWCHHAALGDEPRLLRRLAAEDIDAERARSLLGPVANDGPPPSWLAWFERFLAASLGAEEPPAQIELLTRAEPATPEETPIPFQPLFESATSTFLDGLRSDLEEPVLERVEDSALEDLRLHLLRSLAAPCGPPLYEIFDGFRKQQFDEKEQSADPQGDALYREFLARLFAGDLWRLLELRPALTRTIGLLVEQWHANTRTLLERLAKDHAEISRVFFGGADPGPLTGLELGLSDRHDGGGKVAILNFADGQRVVYKPREMAIEVAWRDFVEGLAEASGRTEVRACDIVARPAYGWAEFITTAPCESAEEVALYFRRCGALLAVF